MDYKRIFLPHAVYTRLSRVGWKLGYQIGLGGGSQRGKVVDALLDYREQTPACLSQLVNLCEYMARQYPAAEPQLKQVVQYIQQNLLTN